MADDEHDITAANDAAQTAGASLGYADLDWNNVVPPGAQFLIRRREETSDESPWEDILIEQGENCGLKGFMITTDPVGVPPARIFLLTSTTTA